MDPWGHVAPWLFKDMVQGEDGMSRLLNSRRGRRGRMGYPDVTQLISGRVSP
jgi:hypothetical protein